MTHISKTNGLIRQKTPGSGRSLTCSERGKGCKSLDCWWFQESKIFGVTVHSKEGNSNYCTRVKKERNPESYSLVFWLCKPHIDLSLYQTKRNWTIFAKITRFFATGPSVRTEAGNVAFQYSVPTTWNNLRKDLKPKEQVPTRHFKIMLNKMEMRNTVCKCLK